MDIVVDAGNGTACLVSDKNPKKAVRVPSVRATVSGRTLGMENEVKIEWVEWNGSRLAFGDEAIKAKTENIETHSGENRYGNDHHRSLVIYSMVQGGIPSGDHNLCLFVPPDYFLKKRDYIIGRFQGIEFSMTTSKGKTFRYTFPYVRVIPEGFGGLMSFLYDWDGHVVTSKLFTGNLALMDGGAETVDLLIFKNGEIALEEVKRNTYPLYGINEKVRKPILAHLGRQGYDLRHFTENHLDAVIRRGYTTGDFTSVLNGSVVDLQETILGYVNQYGEYICNTFIDGELAGLNGVDNLLVMGGMDLLIGQKIRDYYNAKNAVKVVEAKSYPHTKSISPLDMNAIGGYKRMKNAALAQR